MSLVDDRGEWVSYFDSKFCSILCRVLGPGKRALTKLIVLFTGNGGEAVDLSELCLKS